MSKVVFPIKSDKACLLKWNWSSVFLNDGTSASCHRTKKYSVNPDNFSAFHNLPEKLQDRKHMLEGVWPGNGCEYCRSVEDSGGISDRIFQLDQLYDHNLIPPELVNDANAVNITPTILEVYFKNTCNMACVYCGPYFSSKWQDENRKYGLIKEQTQLSIGHENKHYDKMLQGLWDFLQSSDNAKKIQRFHILGGEPFLLNELDQSIAFWAKHGHPDLQISIISNLNIPHARFQNYMKKFELLATKNKIWRLQLTASLDCWGAEQEYVRFGLSQTQWQQNFEYLLNKPWVNLSINSVVSALTIKSLPQLIEKINHWNSYQSDVVDPWRSYSNKILHSFNTSGLEDNPYYFSGDTFADNFQAVLDLMPMDTEVQQGQKKMMEGIAKQSASCGNNFSKIANLQKYLSELDIRRGTNWRDTFPWLEQIKA